MAMLFGDIPRYNIHIPEPVSGAKMDKSFFMHTGCQWKHGLLIKWG